MANLKDVVAFCKGVVGSCKTFADLKAKISGEFGARDAIAGKVIDNMHHRWNSGGNVPGVLTEVFEGIGSEKSPEASVPSVALTPVPLPSAKVAAALSPAPKPAAAPVGAAKPIALKPAPVLTPESIGRAVITTTTAADPTVRNASQAALTTITNAARLMARSDFNSLSPSARMGFIKAGGLLTDNRAGANVTADDVEKNPAKPTLASGAVPVGTPDFSFLPLGGKKMSMMDEYAENGGLTEASWFVWFTARQRFFQDHGVTPEAMTGKPVVIPAIVLESKAQCAARLKAWADGDDSFKRRIASIELSIAQHSGDPTSLKAGLASTKAAFAKYQAKRQAEHAAAMAQLEERIAAKRAALY